MLLGLAGSAVTENAVRPRRHTSDEELVRRAVNRLYFRAIIPGKHPLARVVVLSSVMMKPIRGAAHLLGDDVNTDIHCSSKYHPGRDNAYVAQHAFEQLAPGFAARFAKGDVIVAGRNFGNNSSREQAVHIMRALGVAAIVATSFGRQLFRNCINNGLPAIECDLGRIGENDALEIDLAGGRISVPARGIVREVPQLPGAVQEIIAAGGLIPFLKAHPDWTT